MKFYEDIADAYDDMTDFRQRLGAGEEFAWRLRGRFGEAGMSSALDVACGTGVYALAFAAGGVELVVGADISEGMLRMARQRAKELGVSVQWVLARMQDLRDLLSEQFDVITCLGNSLPHLLTDSDLESTLAGFRQLLRADGRLFLQLLNYESILADAERIVEITRRGDLEFVRFYDFMPDRLVFNLLKINWEGNCGIHTLSSTELRPYIWATLEHALKRSGFTNIKAYGGLDFSRFNPAASATLLLEAQ